MAYSEKERKKIVKIVCDRLSNGEALRTVMKDKDLPDVVTFYKWIDNDKEKLKQYTRATETRADKIFEDILTIADDQENDVYIDEDGKILTNHNVIQRARLRVDSRKWYLAKLNPKKYSDKIQVDPTPFKEQPLFNTDE